MLTKRQFLQRAGAAAAAGVLGPLALSGAGRAARAAAGRKPNILMIVTDQERSWSSLPPGFVLPRRRDLAASGTSFSRYHVTTGLCGPVRSAIYTGQHVMKTGVFDNLGIWTGSPGLDGAKTPTIASMLRQAGYRTAYKGKWHLGFGDKLGIPANGASRDAPEMLTAMQQFGFEEYQNRFDMHGLNQEGFRQDPVTARDAAAWIARRAAAADEAPWFMAVNLINPHDIMWYDATGRQEKDRYHPNFPGFLVDGAPNAAPYLDAHAFDLPGNVGGPRLNKPKAHRLFDKSYGYFLGPIAPDDTESWRRFYNFYLNCLRDVDAQTGIVLDALAEAGQDDNTIVILTSDHGEMAGAHGHRDKGPFIYPENANVPLVIRHPDVKGGTETDALASCIDLAPTILSLAGIGAEAIADRHPALRGRDLSGSIMRPGDAGARGEDGVLLTYSCTYATNPEVMTEMLEIVSMEDGPEKKKRRAAIPPYGINTSYRQFHRGVYDGRHRYARYFSPADHHRPDTWETLIARNDLELYDTVSDPLCLDNLAARPDEHKATLMMLNDKVNRLIDREIGVDDGAYLPGDPGAWHKA